MREQPHDSGSAIGSSLRSWQMTHWYPATGVMEADDSAGTGTGRAGVVVMVKDVLVVVAEVEVAGMMTARRRERSERAADRE